MTPVFQTTFREQGNCLTAGVASILDRPISDIPELVDTSKEVDPGWLGSASERLASLGYGLAFLPPTVQPAGFALMLGEGPSGWMHVVVAEDGQMVHDPQPGGCGLAEQTGWLVLIPILVER